MKANKVISFLRGALKKIEPEYTIRLREIIYSKSHGHEVCVMQLVGKNAFPKYSPEEILSDPNALIGMSPQDAVIITRLDNLIKERKGKSKVLEIDRNGTIVLADAYGNENRYSEKYISSNREMVKNLNSEDAHDLGYRVGFREGLNLGKYKTVGSAIKFKLLSFIKRPLSK